MKASSHYPNIHWKYLSGYLTGPSALAYHGLSWFSADVITARTKCKNLHHKGGASLIYLYDRDYDTENFLLPIPTTSLFVPKRERAIVDYIRNVERLDLEHLLQGLDDYLDTEDGDCSKLYEMADFYKVPRETVDHWVTEARDYVADTYNNM